MNILFLSPVIPYPQTDGGRQRIHCILEALAATHAVTFVGVGPPDDLHRWDLFDRLTADSFAIVLEAVERDAARLRLPWWAHPTSVSRLERAGLWGRLQQLPLSRYDAVHAETILMAPFAEAICRRNTRASLVVDLPDITSHYRTRVLMAGDQTLLHPRSLRELVQIAQLLALERRAYRAADAIFVCSDVDRGRIEHLTRPGRVTVVPNCTHIGPMLPPALPDAHVLVFIGTMSYSPNDEGVRYFCRDVWPRIRREVPDARFLVVGKSPSPDVLALAGNTEGVEVTGEVDDVRPYLARASASVVPLLAGGGTRLKILESMAAGRAVVSTSVGAEGIEGTGGEHLLLGDSAAELAAECIRVLTDAELRGRLATAGRRRAEEMYDWRSAQDLVRRRYEDISNG